jgi:hypothetical protein
MPTKASASDHDPLDRHIQGETKVLGACVHRNPYGAWGAPRSQRLGCPAFQPGSRVRPRSRESM